MKTPRLTFRDDKIGLCDACEAKCEPLKELGFAGALRLLQRYRGYKGTTPADAKMLDDLLTRLPMTRPGMAERMANQKDVEFDVCEACMAKFGSQAIVHKSIELGGQAVAEIVRGIWGHKDAPEWTWAPAKRITKQLEHDLASAEVRVVQEDTSRHIVVRPWKEAS